MDRLACRASTAAWTTRSVVPPAPAWLRAAAIVGEGSRAAGRDASRGWVGVPNVSRLRSPYPPVAVARSRGRPRDAAPAAFAHAPEDPRALLRLLGLLRRPQGAGRSEYAGINGESPKRRDASKRPQKTACAAQGRCAPPRTSEPSAPERPAGAARSCAPTTMPRARRQKQPRGADNNDGRGQREGGGPSE